MNSVVEQSTTSSRWKLFITFGGLVSPSAKQNTGRSAISCISHLCAISLHTTHLGLTDLLSLQALMIQYFLLTFAVEVSTPLWPYVCIWLVISKDIL